MADKISAPKKYHTISIQHNGNEVMRVPVTAERPGNKPAMMNILKEIIEKYENDTFLDPKTSKNPTSSHK